MSVATGNSVYK